MKLWYLSQNVNNNNYDIFDSCVVVAKNAADAKKLHPYGDATVWDGKTWICGRYTDNTWAPPDKIQARYIGQGS